MKRKILLTNDDGICSEGLERLASCAVKFGEVCIVAPDSQRSGCSHSETLHKPVFLKKAVYPIKGIEAYSCSGTPADCVKAGIRAVMKEIPDTVITGINEGYNCGYDLQYSGTVGAAMEGSNEKSVSIAISEGKDSCHEISEKYLEKILEMLIDRHPGNNRIWNVNIPDCRLSEFRGIKENCSLSRTAVLMDHYRTSMEDEHIKIEVEAVPGEEPEEGSDLKAIKDHFISVSRISNLRAELND